LSRETAQIVQIRKQESLYTCSACGADRGCDCNAPAIEKLRADAAKYTNKKERERQRSQARRDAATAVADVENTEESRAPALPTRVMIDNGRGGYRRATEEEADTFFAVAAAIMNPVLDAWEKADKKQRLAFIRLALPEITALIRSLQNEG
jgi:hypothetical protein